ncbi:MULTISPECIES: S46 family peptidase [unclassified Colwellia]|uniref:S46 family peptidase n=1 Tax=unclassified Colwellia TaxID=196834 RepID=UPI0015F6DEF0|nr:MULTISPECIES: S46 family peptidase [unclassified Colwellia]MBA6231646.1 S46 family peptidase [Colwellia sp. MB02u-7]MBA6235510.1 S46 family peptidase [Colwellia sp. MB02u-11]MBA6258064.1 S46 family peptidase [Colwellia sp. MB3u-28]MBA6259758.1 S46 family peptidase [Colwellia sp. MB3u-41]MBA6300234.1 S46 family peptidase [Colwellia sp. MB3u-22]
MKKTTILLLAMASTLATADEGMWQPHQLPSIAKELTQAGLKLNPNDLTDLTGFPMGAIVSLGGCTASFVSDKGLVASNHHCVYGSVQYNSTAENNLLANGFLAKTIDEELPATPGSRIYVTEEINDVTVLIKGSITENMSGSERYKAIDKNSKTLVAECESDDKYRCNVVNFHGGLEYYLFKQLTIRDVRLVHAPASSVGKYGGDVDNWMWPRHTGDYGFYRAYVGKDGQPADFSKDNVPYEPKHHLKVNKSSVDEGDYIMVLGYPGRTNRYRTALEVENQFTWTYPNAKNYREELIDLIHTESAPESEARIKYESTLAGLANYAKNYGSMIKSYHKGTTLARKQQLEQDLSAWINADKMRKAKYGNALTGLNKLLKQNQKTQARDLILGYMAYNKMLSTAYRLHRLAVEKNKPNVARERGYQERDLARFEQSMKTFNRRFDANIDQKILFAMLTHYVELPKSERILAIDEFFELEQGLNKKALSTKLEKMYQRSTIADQETRLAWMNKSVADFEKSSDPFIQLAVKTFSVRKALEEKDEELSGNIQAYRPKYMEALIAYFNDKKLPVYADANSTLRITYGNVKGYSPVDGLTATPFTTLEGIVEKDTGIKPFNASKKQLELIKSKTYGEYAKKELGSVPVNYLGTLDITGGNSGSPTLNDKAEFVGLVFDGVYESIIGDWDYDTKLNRSIHVDIKYMLWVMEHVDGATNLIEEMDIVE